MSRRKLHAYDHPAITAPRQARAAKAAGIDGFVIGALNQIRSDGAWLDMDRTKKVSGKVQRHLPKEPGSGCARSHETGRKGVVGRVGQGPEGRAFKVLWPHELPSAGGGWRRDSNSR